jgi:hypothetical protein
LVVLSGYLPLLIDTNIAEVQAKKVVLWPLDDVELIDWSNTNYLARFWYCHDIHHFSILKLAIEKAIKNLHIIFYQASCLMMTLTMNKISLLGVCLHTRRPML